MRQVPTPASSVGRLVRNALGEVQPGAWLKWYSLYTRCGSSSAARSRSRTRRNTGSTSWRRRKIWTDVDRLKIPARSLDEPRFQVIGRVGEQTWSAFITYRNEKIRISSVRRARADEEARYVAD